MFLSPSSAHLKAIKLKNLINRLEIPFKDLNSNIKYLHDFGSHLKIINFIFPLKENPIWIEIVAHIVFDGNENADGANYSSRNLIEQQIFKKLIKESKLGDYESMNKLYGIPSVIISILRHHYGIKSLKSNTIFSRKIIDRAKNDKEVRSSILRASFIDEGCASRPILIYSSLSNIRLAKQVEKIAKWQGYSVRRCVSNNKHSLYLHAKSYSDFDGDIVSTLPLEYYKRIKFEKWLGKSHFPKKLKYIQFLKQKRYVKNSDFWRTFNITRSSAYYLLSSFEKEGLLKKIDRGIYVYG